MRLDLEIGGRVRRVVIERRDGEYQVAVDDRVFVVDARAVGRESLSLLVREGDGGVRSVDATLAARPGGVHEVSIDGHTLHALPVSAFGRRSVGGTAAGGGPQRVVAPMPGKVVRVLVAPGDAVEPRQGLVVVEAMKMENELRAATAGRVQSVRVAEGQSVEAGALLVIVE